MKVGEKKTLSLKEVVARIVKEFKYMPDGNVVYVYDMICGINPKLTKVDNNGTFQLEKMSKYK